MVLSAPSDWQHLRGMPVELLEPEFRKLRLGTCAYIANTVARAEKGIQSLWVCAVCGTEQRKWLHNMLAGRGLQCMCQRNRIHEYGDAVAKVLMWRYCAAKERCKAAGTNSKYYGQRGVEMRFASCQEYIKEIRSLHPALTLAELAYLQVDRIDNNGHYEPGNIRLVTVRENLLNRREYTTSLTRGRVADSLLKGD